MTEQMPVSAHVPMTRPDLMLAQYEQQCGHASTFVNLDDERIMHWAGNAYAVSEDGGLTWSEMTRAQDEAGNSISSESVVNLDKGIGVVSRVRPQGDPPIGGELLFYRSLDNGKSWEQPVRIDTNHHLPHMLQNAAQRLSSGRIIIPVYSDLRPTQPKTGPRQPPFVGALLQTGQWVSTSAHFYDPSQGACWVIYSDDEGGTWRPNRGGMLFPWTDWEIGVHAAYEPVLTEIVPGKLLMFVRTWLGRLYQSVSEDNGETWTPPSPTDLAADHSPAALATIPDTGHLICIWSQHGEDEIKAGKVRTRLSSAVSRNSGLLWEFFQNVESIYPETRVPPGPIRPCRPEESYLASYEHCQTWNPRHVQTLPAHYGRWSYPSLHVTGDRALIAHTYSKYDDDGIRHGGSRLKVLPLEWFYGGRDRIQPNPNLPDIFEPAKP